MPDAESFIAAVAANPADDLPRLVFADWLDENGDPARAAFIRDHVALAKLRPGTEEFKALFRKCADTLRANLPGWIKPACDAFGEQFKWKVGKSVPPAFRVELGPDRGVPLSSVEFANGFVAGATLDLTRVSDSAPTAALFRSYPITKLVLALPASSTDVERVLPSSPLPVRSLRLFGAMTPENMRTVFRAPALAAVTEVVAAFGGLVHELIGSPMARRITTLRSAGDSEVLEALREFPLDDKLQEFTLFPVTMMGGPRSILAHEQAGTPMAFWSALSRVSFRPTLKRLDLTRCGMTDDGLAAFARGEAWLRLQGLKLGGNLFGDRGWADFCRGWRTPELTYLDVSRNRLTDAGASMLAASGMMKTVRVIDLRGNRIAGPGALALARRSAEAKVTKLLLAGNPLAKKDAAAVRGLLGERTDV